MITRRAFTSAAIAAPFAARAQRASDSARIKIDTDRVISDIDPMLYGNFVEHLGRCIDGGIFQEGSKLSDANGYRKDVLQSVKELNLGILRWPGGNFSSNYHWRDGVGPRDQRPPRLEMAWATVENDRFGTHEFLQYTEMLGTQPYICTNLGTGSWEEAQQWVEYVNSSEDTAMTRLRKQNGRRDPWKVKYWGLGNEMDGPWQMGHRSAEDYGKFALEAAKLMKWTDPSIKLIAAGSSNFGAGSDWTGWNRTVLEYLKNHVDYLSLHMYVGNPQNDYLDFLASSLELADRIKTAEGTIRAALSGMPRSKKLYIAWDEWNVWYRARGDQGGRGRRALEEHYNLEDMLVVATFLNTFINNSHIVKMANLAQLVNVIAPIFTNDEGFYIQTIYHPLQLFAAHTRGKALDVFVDSPTYENRRFGQVPYLDVSAALDGETVVINVVNRHRDQSIAVEFEAEDKQFAGPAEITETSGPDIKAENDFTTMRVRPAERTATAQGKKFAVRMSPHSYTMLKVKLV